MPFLCADYCLCVYGMCTSPLLYSINGNALECEGACSTSRDILMIYACVDIQCRIREIFNHCNMHKHALLLSSSYTYFYVMISHNHRARVFLNFSIHVICGMIVCHLSIYCTTHSNLHYGQFFSSLPSNDELL